MHFDASVHFTVEAAPFCRLTRLIRGSKSHFYVLTTVVCRILLVGLLGVGRCDFEIYVSSFLHLVVRRFSLLKRFF